MGEIFPDFSPPIKNRPQSIFSPILSDRQIAAINDNGLESLILMTGRPRQNFPIHHQQMSWLFLQIFPVLGRFSRAKSFSYINKNPSLMLILSCSFPFCITHREKKLLKVQMYSIQVAIKNLILLTLYRIYWMVKSIWNASFGKNLKNLLDECYPFR
jgi:hypothetical protein